MPFRALGEPPKSSDYLDAEIFHFCGIFTVFSIVVSIYTLTSSSIDRYLAVRFPIKYKQRTRAVKILTIIMLSLTWLSAICFSIAPIWAPTLKYGFISGAIMVFVIPDDSQVNNWTCRIWKTQVHQKCPQFQKICAPLKKFKYLFHIMKWIHSDVLMHR